MTWPCLRILWSVPSRVLTSTERNTPKETLTVPKRPQTLGKLKRVGTTCASCANVTISNVHARNPGRCPNFPFSLSVYILDPVYPTSTSAVHHTVSNKKQKKKKGGELQQWVSQRLHRCWLSWVQAWHWQLKPQLRVPPQAQEPSPSPPPPHSFLFSLPPSWLCFSALLSVSGSEDVYTAGSWLWMVLV
ncbi:hypothetical protein GQ457_08G000170 [Hibiscus cannabinus]